MSSLVNEITLSQNYNQLASEISDVLSSDQITWTDESIKDFIESVDFNQATTTAMSKPSIDDEILFHLKTQNEELESNPMTNFNLIEV